MSVGLMEGEELKLRYLHVSHILGHGTWGTGTPKDRDEFNRREVCKIV